MADEKADVLERARERFSSEGLKSERINNNDKALKRMATLDRRLENRAGDYRDISQKLEDEMLKGDAGDQGRVRHLIVKLIDKRLEIAHRYEEHKALQILSGKNPDDTGGFKDAQAIMENDNMLGDSDVRIPDPLLFDILNDKFKKHIIKSETKNTEHYGRVLKLDEEIDAIDEDTTEAQNRKRGLENKRLDKAIDGVREMAELSVLSGLYNPQEEVAAIPPEPKEIFREAVQAPAEPPPAEPPPVVELAAATPATPEVPEAPVAETGPTPESLDVIDSKSKAVKLIQRGLGLEETGKIDPKTQTELAAFMGTVQEDSTYTGKHEGIYGGLTDAAIVNGGDSETIAKARDMLPALRYMQAQGQTRALLTTAQTDYLDGGELPNLALLAQGAQQTPTQSEAAVVTDETPEGDVDKQTAEILEVTRRAKEMLFADADPEQVDAFKTRFSNEMGTDVDAFINQDTDSPEKALGRVGNMHKLYAIYTTQQDPQVFNAAMVEFKQAYTGNDQSPEFTQAGFLTDPSEADALSPNNMFTWFAAGLVLAGRRGLEGTRFKGGSSSAVRKKEIADFEDDKKVLADLEEAHAKKVTEHQEKTQAIKDAEADLKKLQNTKPPKKTAKKKSKKKGGKKKAAAGTSAADKQTLITEKQTQITDLRKEARGLKAEIDAEKPDIATRKLDIVAREKTLADTDPKTIAKNRAGALKNVRAVNRIERLEAQRKEAQAAARDTTKTPGEIAVAKGEVRDLTRQIDSQRGQLGVANKAEQNAFKKAQNAVVSDASFKQVLNSVDDLRIGRWGAGAGIGFGSLSLAARVFGAQGRADVADENTRGVAMTGRALDASAIAVDTLEIATRNKALSAAKVLQAGDDVAKLATASRVLRGVRVFGRAATPIAVAASVASGGVEYELGRRTGDAKRAADGITGAAGGATGAIAGAAVGAKVGALVGVWFGGVGAAPGAVIGGLAGGLIGAWGGSKTLQHYGSSTAQAYFEGSFGINQKIKNALAQTDARAEAIANLNQDGGTTIDEVKAHLAKAGITSIRQMDTDKDGTLSGQELSNAIHQAGGDDGGGGGGGLDNAPRPAGQGGDFHIATNQGDGSGDDKDPDPVRPSHTRKFI